MENLTSLLVILIGLSMFACTSTHSKEKTAAIPDKDSVTITYPIALNLETAVEQSKEVALSDVADRVEYVKLENKTAAFIRRPNNVVVTDSFIFVGQYNSMLQFSRDGKFIRQVGKQGRGPKEYAHVYHFTVNEKLKEVYVNAGELRVIQVYDFNGNHLRRLKYMSNSNFDMVTPNAMASFRGNYFGEEKCKLLITDAKNDTLLALPRSDQFARPERCLMMMGPFDRFFYRYNDQLHFKAMYDDTVFCVKNTNLVEARYILNKGKYKLPADKRIERVRDFRKYAKIAAPYLNAAVQEVNDYVFVNYTSFSYQGDKQHLALYNKQTSNFYTVGTKETPGFRNDLDGIGHFIPYRIYADHRMIDYYTAINFIEDYEEEIKQGSASAAFKDFYKDVKEDDNLIVQIVHLKEKQPHLAMAKE